MSAGRLPDFLIIGAMRSGSTSLARYLGVHPQVFMAREKELRYFLGNHRKGVDWYRAQFAEARDQQLAGEATPGYLADERATNRMWRLLPDARLLVIARNPVDRAWSHYWMRKERALETRDFRQAVADELEQLSTQSPDAPGSDYLRHGLYAAHLERLCRRFPRQHVHLTVLERLERRPLDAYVDVCRFLAIDDSVVPDLLGRRINRYVTFRSSRLRTLGARLPSPLERVIGRVNVRPEATYPPLDSQTRQDLTAFFEPQNQAFERFLGSAVPEWRA